MPLQPIIAWDYLFAPNAQKSRLYLYLTQTAFSICEQPFALPRPDLTALGVTYRRVPVLSIGKDVFPDNASFLAAMQELLREEGRGRELRESIWDTACDAWGYVSVLFLFSFFLSFSPVLFSFLELGLEFRSFARLDCPHDNLVRDLCVLTIHLTETNSVHSGSPSPVCRVNSSRRRWPKTAEICSLFLLGRILGNYSLVLGRSSELSLMGRRGVKGSLGMARVLLSGVRRRWAWRTFMLFGWLNG
jgi:hypothetical protein